MLALSGNIDLGDTKISFYAKSEPPNHHTKLTTSTQPPHRAIFTAIQSETFD